MRYWWVNHKQTHRAEIDGGYIWSPKMRKDGAENVFYSNMRRAYPGDGIISFADAKISYIGRVDDYAIEAPKPKEFGPVGENWLMSGWLVPVSWRDVKAPIRPKDYIDQIGPLLPGKYSPIRRETGDGHQGAYLAEISDELFHKVCALTQFGALADVAQTSVIDRESIEREIEARLAALHIDETELLQISKARRGQGKFRENVLEIEPRCRVTGIDDPEFLRASHIKPWRSCETALERLDGRNGLMLAPHVDFLFDKGFITFEDDGRVKVSPVVSQETLDRLGLAEAVAAKTGAFTERQIPYLEYHRTNVFVAG